jgi:fumarate reductase subunit C
VSAARAETWLFVAQRASAVVLAACVAVHLAVIIYAAQVGISAAAILSRTRGAFGWMAFYGVFVAAIAVHAPIGLRAILRETTRWRGLTLDLAVVAFALLLVALGTRAIGSLAW